MVCIVRREREGGGRGGAGRGGFCGSRKIVVALSLCVAFFKCFFYCFGCEVVGVRFELTVTSGKCCGWFISGGSTRRIPAQPFTAPPWPCRLSLTLYSFQSHKFFP